MSWKRVAQDVRGTTSPKSRKLPFEQSMKKGQKFGDSDEDNAPPNGFDDILNEICEEAHRRWGRGG